MKKSLLILFFFTLFCSCGEHNKNHPFEGTFIIDTGLKFELRSDSTAQIMFSDSSVYDSHWSVNIDTRDESKFAVIEFAGYSRYYYLRNGKLYRSMREMRHDAFGQEVSYIN